MSPKLNEILQQAETLPTDEQLQLIAYLVQKMRQVTLANLDSSQSEVIQPGHKTGKSIWEIAQDITNDMTEEEIAQLPSDGAEQHDHYIYGTPKRPT